uniref:HMA domain-containing protein n=1 Tax=Arundo donax TaxID=35708 RepID=A0A0A8XUE4_ARUDO
MSKEDVVKVQTCVLKVNVHCDGCEKKIKKTLHKIDGVYQSSIDAEQGKVTVSGLVDPDTIIRKLSKAGKPAQLLGSKAGGVSQLQLQHGGGGKYQPKDAGVKGRSKDAGGKGHKGGADGGGGGKDTKMALPQQLQHLMRMKGLKLPKFMGGKMPFAAAPPVKDPKSVKFTLPEDGDFEDDGSEFDDEFDDFDDDDDFEDDGLDDDLYDDHKMVMKPMAMPLGAGGGGGKKGGGGGNEVPVQIKGNNGGGKSKGGGQAQNAKGGAPGGGEKGTAAVGAGGPMAMSGGSMNMPLGHPHMGIMQQGGGGGGMAAAGFYQGGGSGSMPAGTELLQAAAAVGNPMAQQQYMALVQQQQMMMMMNGHGHGHGHRGHGGAGYPPMDYGYGRPAMHYPMGYAMPPHPGAEPYNVFSDENPNSCSVM